MKKVLAASFIIIIYILFAGFNYYRNLEKLVLKVIEPTVIQVDLNNNKIFDEGETICAANIDSFTSNLNSDKEELAKKLNITHNQAVSIGYLADEFADKTLFNKKVKLKFNGNQNNNCRYADIYVNHENYAELLANAGFGIKDNKPVNKALFEKNLDKAKKFKLVILNHNSNKYHKLDCKYGLTAHDAIVIFAQQLPNDAKPCKFCHINKKTKELIIENKIPNYPLMITNGSIKLYLTDFTTKLKPDNKCESQVCKEVLNQINSAQTSIDMAVYGWEKNLVLEEGIKNAKSRGVKFRLVYDEVTNQKDYYPDIKNLVRLSDTHNSDYSENKTFTNMLMHNKFMIFDNQKVLTGSMNYSRTGLSGFNANSLLLINSKEISAKYTQEFEQMLSGKFHKNKTLLSKQTYILGDTKITPLFSPKDMIITNNIIPLINNSQKYIYIPAFLVTHKSMIDSLISAKKKGVDVKIIIDATSTNNYKKIKTLRDNGIQLKVENYAGKMHSKSIIIDDKYLVLGSMNFSYSGENKNDENSIIIENQRLAKYYRGYFEYLWSKIPDKYLKHNVRAESIYSIGSCTDSIDNNFDGKIDKDDIGCKPKI